MGFKLWDRFWNLQDGPLDPLDRYKILKTNWKIDFLDHAFMFDPWPAVSDHLNLQLDAGKPLEL